VIIDEFWIDDRIYWTFWCSAWLHFANHCHKQTSVCLWRLWSAWPSFPVARCSRWLLSNCSRCSHLEAAHPKGFPDKVQVGPGVPPSSMFFSEGCA
jgi:hypothetical protein